MDSTSEADSFWKAVISQTLTGGYTGKNPLILSKYYDNGREVPRPDETSFLHRSLGELKLQKADWRASFQNLEHGFHAVEFEYRYECHIDKVDPDKNPIGHLVEDSPGTLVLLIAVPLLFTAGGVAYYFYRKKKKIEDED